MRHHLKEMWTCVNMCVQHDNRWLFTLVLALLSADKETRTYIIPSQKNSQLFVVRGDWSEPHGSDRSRWDGLAARFLKHSVIFVEDKKISSIYIGYYGIYYDFHYYENITWKLSNKENTTHSKTWRILTKFWIRICCNENKYLMIQIWLGPVVGIPLLRYLLQTVTNAVEVLWLL